MVATAGRNTKSTPRPFVSAAILEHRERRLGRVLLCVGAALATSVPFLIWDAAALWRAAVLFHLDTPFRADGMTLAAWLFGAEGGAMPSWLGPLVATLVLIGGTVWLRHRGLVAELALASTAYLALFFLSAYAFPNYYHFVMGLLLAGGLVKAIELENDAGERAA